MGIRILPYRRGSELPPLIRSFLGPGVNARFIVPSRGDFSWWRRHAGREQQAPCDPQADPVWTWQELYDDIAAFYGVSRRHPFSPPDRKLILRHLLTSALEEDPELVKLWPGLG
ncbi:MAG: hypothetical protein IJU98_11285 [Synergistaceae bacterium]|nr:hypothetical protein [Synergistaceae bacterium]